MRRVAVPICVCCLLVALVTIPVVAQSKTAELGQVYVMAVKPGMTKQFEEGRKRHADWHRKQNDTWSWDVWQIETGPGTGEYLSTAFGHTWKDFDTWEQKLGAGDTADGETNITPYVASVEESIWMVMKDESRPPEGPPSGLSDVEHFVLKPGTTQNFSYAVKKITEAVDKTKWPVHFIWYSLVNGGQTPQYVLLIPAGTWEGMADPEPSFPAMLEKALGRHEAEEVMHEIDKSVEREWNEVVRYRADLSYRPAGK